MEKVCEVPPENVKDLYLKIFIYILKKSGLLVKLREISFNKTKELQMLETQFHGKLTRNVFCVKVKIYFNKKYFVKSICTMISRTFRDKKVKIV